MGPGRLPVAGSSTVWEQYAKQQDSGQGLGEAQMKGSEAVVWIEQRLSMEIRGPKLLSLTKVYLLRWCPFRVATTFFLTWSWPSIKSYRRGSRVSLCKHYKWKSNKNKKLKKDKNVAAL